MSERFKDPKTSQIFPQSFPRFAGSPPQRIRVVDIAHNVEKNGYPSVQITQFHQLFSVGVVSPIEIVQPYEHR